MKPQPTDSPKITLTRQQTVILRRNDFYTLIKAAQWILQGRRSRLPHVARKRLKDIVDTYYGECNKQYKTSALGRQEKEKSQTNDHRLE